MDAGNRHRPSFVAARSAAEAVRKAMGLADDASFPVGLVLGTGWGDVLDLADKRELSFKQIPGFAALGALEGHARTVVAGSLGITRAVMLRGRVHLNEAPADPDIHRMVRLQTEMLIHLGARTIILTCAAGSLTPRVKVGDVVFIDGFISAFAPDMPLYAGEFVSPDDAIDQELLGRTFRRIGMIARMFAKAADPKSNADPVKKGGYAMLRGPFFEGRRYDKRLLARAGGAVVGMSMLPEACVAALYRPEGVRILPLAFVTNSAFEEHSHEENMRRAKATSGSLGAMLTELANRSTDA